ncbi:coagulation factor III, tissue factor a [Denticeps clupeoides]|uniref:Tissue factor n=1 Tax=Denticeps clupeoides TaxID=299321 RepID=A0AAY4C698_9TELE|nr:tissue factor-like [Denticeps clupeoides]
MFVASLSLCAALLLVLLRPASGSFPRAQNVSWLSLNFKTLLTWSPRPVNYSHTVEYYMPAHNKERSPFCIRTAKTECDLTRSLKNLDSVYIAEVLSEPLPGVTSDLIEFPYTRSEPFCPYKDTQIGKPDFRYKVSKDTGVITLYITDPLTAVQNERGENMNIRDIFKNDLQYKVTYRRAKSTGQKTKVTRTSQIELTDVDKGESYCVSVQAYIPSRQLNKQLGEPSSDQCTPGEKGFLDEYGLNVIVGGIALILAVVLAIVIGVVCCKRQRKEKKRTAEDVPLKHV